MPTEGGHNYLIMNLCVVGPRDDRRHHATTPASEKTRKARPDDNAGTEQHRHQITGLSQAAAYDHGVMDEIKKAQELWSPSKPSPQERASNELAHLWYVIQSMARHESCTWAIYS